MDIVFQTGDYFGNDSSFNWLTDFGIPSLSIIIPTLLAVLLFRAEKRNERRKRDEEKVKEEKTRKERISFFTEHFKTLANAIIEGSHKQVVNYEKSINKINRHPFETPTLGLVTMENLERILSIDTHLILEMFKESELQNSELISMLNQFDFIKNSFHLNRISYESQQQTVTTLKNSIIQTHEIILERIAVYLGQNLDRNEDDYFHLLNKILVEYYPVYNRKEIIEQDELNKEKMDTILIRDKHEDKISTPILLDILKSEHKTREISHFLISNNKTINNSIYSIEEGNKMFAEQVENSISEEKGVRKALNTLETIINKL